MMLRRGVDYPRYKKYKYVDPTGQQNSVVDTVLFDLTLNYYKLPPASSSRTIITLSTIPERISLLGPTLASLLDQTVRVNEIAINVPYVSRKGIEYEIPDWLDIMSKSSLSVSKGKKDKEKKRENIIRIYRVEKDLGPATKLIPTMLRERERTFQANVNLKNKTTENKTINDREWIRETRIIVVDDDNIYNKHMVQRLVDCFENDQKRIESKGELERVEKLETISNTHDSHFEWKGPSDETLWGKPDRNLKAAAITNFGLVLNEGFKIPKTLTTSRLKSIFCASREVDIVQGFSGFLVTPSMFDQRVYDLSVIGKIEKDSNGKNIGCPKEALTVDDIWFSGWLKVSNTRIICTGEFHKYLPLVVGGSLSKTPDLWEDENKMLTTNDQKTLDWFSRQFAFE